MIVEKSLLFILLAFFAVCGVKAQSASFNFTAFPHTVTGWTNVVGDPGTGVRTATVSGFTISSVATANWSPLSSHCATDSLGENINGFFPAAVLFNHWFTYEAVYNAAKPQFKITGLNKSTLYTLKVTGSATGTPSTNPTLYTVIGLLNYGAIAVNTLNNNANGAIFTNVYPDATGSIQLFVSSSATTEADIAGVTISASPVLGSQLSLGAGLAQVGSTLALGDSLTGIGRHSFNSNRYQYLNGHQYSIGGSVKDAANHPAFRLYDNGDLTGSTTMDKSVNTDAQTGLRFYSKHGILQLGATDRMDTTIIVDTNWSGGGFLVNSNSGSNPNILKGKFNDSYVQGSGYNVDSTGNLDMVVLNGQNSVLKNGLYSADIITGSGLHLGAWMDNNIISGTGGALNNLNSMSNINGANQTSKDTVFGSLVGGSGNVFGGWWQLVSGVNLINPTPVGTTLGSGNVDYSSLGYTSTYYWTYPNLIQYPVFQLGNSSSNGGFRSNAMTVLYSGRTQINTKGFSSALTAAQVTPQAALDVVSTNSGVLLPRLTTTQLTAIANSDLQNSLLLYNTDSSAFQYYNGTAWLTMGGASPSARWSFNAGSIYDSLDNIALGTSNPQGYKLAVNGPAIFDRMVVKAAAYWPDFVFAPGFRLKSLAELERYVRTRRHLPGIAGAQEVDRSGIDIAGQQIALLRNAEELTLRLIRQNEELRSQNRQLSEQATLLDAHQKEIDELTAILKSSK